MQQGTKTSIKSQKTIYVEFDRKFTKLNHKQIPFVVFWRIGIIAVMPVLKFFDFAKHVSQSFMFELFVVKMLQRILTYFLTLVSAKFKQEIQRLFFFSQVVGLRGAASAEVASFLFLHLFTPPLPPAHLASTKFSTTKTRRDLFFKQA